MPSRSFSALWGGRTCPKCDELVKEGETVHYNGKDEIEHITCPTPPGEAARNEKLCKKCFCYHAGECA